MTHYKPIFRFCGSFLGLWLLIFGVATAQKKDTIQVPKESIRFAGIRLGINLVPPLTAILDKNYRFYEASAEVMLGKKYTLTGEFGAGSAQRMGTDYQTSGAYWRIGADYNLWHRDSKQLDSWFLIGLRYGQAIFDYDLNTEIDNPYWGDTPFSASESGLSAGWLEAVFSVRAKLFQNFHIAPMVKWKFLVHQSTPAQIEKANYFPGYGPQVGMKIEIGYQLFYTIGKTK